MTGRDQRAGRRRRIGTQALALDADRDHFVQVASHDLREPVRQISGLCAAVLRDYSKRLDERGRDYLIQAASAARRMGRLIEALGEYARLGTASQALTDFDAGESLERALEWLEAPIRTSGAMVTADTLPRILGTPDRLPSVFQNLIGNAVKHAPAGAPPRIHVSAAPDGAFWRFSVSDNGGGIDPRDQADIFEPFRQLAPADEVGGAGLGLPICRKIVEDMGGRIWVSSSLGHGATFHFTLKAAEGPPATAGLTIEVGGRPARFLLVEDSAGEVLLTEDAFLTAGLSNPVRVARDGPDALDVLREGAPPAGADVVLLDLNLPRMDGQDVLRAIRADRRLRSVKVIVVSGFDSELELQDPIGADAWLSKPLQVAQLAAAVRGWADFRISDAVRGVS